MICNVMQIRTSLSTPPLQDAEWDRFAGTQPAGHVLQSSAWGALKARFGWPGPIRAGVFNHAGQLVAGAQILFRPLLPLSLSPTLAYVPKGPIVDWQNPELCRILIRSLATLARRQGAVLLKLEPDLPDSPTLAAHLQALGLHPSAQTVQPRATTLLDLRIAPDALLASMHQKTRYNIRLSERKGVTVRAATRADLPRFNELMAATARRDGFAVHAPAYYETAFDLFVPHAAQLFLAIAGDQLLAGLFAFAFGPKAWYMYGASANEGRERMPNHALQWVAIRWAQARGCQVYDFWGIPDEVGQAAKAGLDRQSPACAHCLSTTPLADLSSVWPPAEQVESATPEGAQGGLWGVWRFKQGFGGHVMRFAGAWDLPLYPGVYLLYQRLLSRGGPTA